ncbi:MULTISPECIES: LLM class flavin-dependent oxidoreductase [unclassified Streptosporangium]|uniref:LLM class flavin-dependent oxidoreductase n=1 Tax=unclassified Streptosporangium TaxID=2632669 RepID=UPI002E2BF0F5|nr:MULTISPECIES: LLM class flavin-dependent oxidoreductase [unclassified Streptosporangium]
MNVGLGLPISDPLSLLSWARRADAGPFTTLGLLDRLVYANPEPLVTLAAIAGATSRIRVQTEVLLGPLRQSALLAKQTATLDRVSDGRFTLGVGIGARQDDYLAAGIDVRRRGRRLDRQLTTLRRVWSGEPYSEEVGPIGPAPVQEGGPEILIGAFAPAALERVARWGDGYLCAAPAALADRLMRDVERFWSEAGRHGRPRMVAQVNVALGPEDTVQDAKETITSYYGFLGDTTRVVENMLTTPERIRDAITAFADLGADEVILYCWARDADQIDRLADVAV